jgi:hypothetical protein
VEKSNKIKMDFFEERGVGERRGGRWDFASLSGENLFENIIY